MANTDEAVDEVVDPHLAQMKAVEEMIPGLKEPDPDPSMEDIDEQLAEVGKHGLTEVQEEAETLAGVNIDDPAVAELISQMGRKIAILEGEVSSIHKKAEPKVDGSAGGYPWQFYRNPEWKGHLQGGWITYAPGGATPQGRRNAGSFAHYMRRGLKPLTAYGPAPIPSQVHGMPPGSAFIPIFERGGVREFPVSQVLAHKWHVRPPVHGLVFPQVEEAGEEVLHFICDDCDWEFYFLKEDSIGARVCFQHLRKDTGDGKHGYRREEAALALQSQGLPYLGRFAGQAEEAARTAIKGDGAPMLEKTEPVD